MKSVNKVALLYMFACFNLTYFSSVFADTQVNVVGLFIGKAVVVINNGKPQTLSVGQTVGVVKLIASDSETATFQIEGKRKTLGMGRLPVLVAQLIQLIIRV